jgi:hypothetical protein
MNIENRGTGLRYKGENGMGMNQFGIKIHI